MLAPIVLFVYNRPRHTQQTVEALQKCDLAEGSDLYIFADGPKKNASEEVLNRIAEVRQYIHSIDGFRSIQIDEAPQNIGCADSIINGVTKVIEKHGEAIVVEDDIVAHPFFLRFMNEALDVYEKNKRIFCISATTVANIIPSNYKYDVFLSHRTGSWGWATWKNRWNSVEWDIKKYPIIKHPTKMRISKLCRGGGDLWPMMIAQKDGNIDAWDIRWLYNMLLQKSYCLYPTQSFTKNIGMDNSGTHCGENNITLLPLYAHDTFKVLFPTTIKLDNRISKNIKKVCSMNSTPICVWQIIKKYVKKVIKKKKKIQPQNSDGLQKCSIHPSTILRQFETRFDNPIEDKKYITIGKDCIVSGNFIFESKDGHINIGNHCYIGGGTYISRSGIEIGNNVTIAWGGTVYDHDSHSINHLNRRKDIDNELDDIRKGRNFILSKDWTNVKSAPIKICDDVWIGMNVIILKGCTIGEGAVIGAGSVVTHDVPAWTLAAGNPAKVVKTIEHSN